MPEGSIAKSYYPDAAEVKDGLPPVASEGMDYFRFMAEAAVDQGFISSEGVSRVMDALKRDSAY